jgi:hypothetical protein
LARKILLFELNEVPFEIIDAYCRWRPDSCLARVLPHCSQFTTLAEDSLEKIPHGSLSPWITWPSLHRGVLNDQHGITHFGQDLSQVDRELPPLWKLLADDGVAPGIFGSLHTYPLPEDVERYAFYVPDTFAAGPETHPPSYQAFQAFNLAMAKDSPRNVSTDIHWGPALAFLAAAPGMGLEPSTALDIAKQLVSERMKPWTRGRRRTTQAVLAFDLWMKLLERKTPAFSTFFSNNVASTMHRFWAATFPEQYEQLDFDDEWIATYRGEIAFAMERFDRWLARLVRFVDRRPDYQLLIASSMGQAATHAEPVASQLYARDVDRLLAGLGLTASEWSRRPAMEPDVNLLVAPGAADRLQAALETLVIDGRPARFDRRSDDFFSLVFGERNLDPDAGVQLAGREIPFETLGLRVVEIEDRAGSTAYHTPEGILLAYDPRQQERVVTRSKVSTIEIAPYVLGNFGTPIPGYMRSSGELERSLA